ncbi:hypothetical protein [Dictyobacter kobayashii]|uniref:Uncharacterized protein n=1 Tax=Dictyobacter kobayashii TaxID=2014872 RepID=A0A402AHI0_9CHLR|nr:hypothetical protein [Dictyobacter kobayashii]GCE18494.1 hypothetical protein KDK_22940 [Dictyobacter kobayashii]
MAARFSYLEPGDTFCGGQGFVHWFTEETLKEELAQSDFQLAIFQSDEQTGGKGLIRLVRLIKPLD